MKRILIALFSFSFFYLTAQPKLPDGFIPMEIMVNVNPLAMDFDPSGRLFVTELNGKIWIIENDTVKREPVGIIPVENIGERGLYGIAFDPEFEFNNYIYLYYSVAGGNHNRLSRFKLDDDHIHNDDEEILLELGSTTSVIHNGGDIEFGPDGKLYVAVGDGGVPQNAQNLSTLFGKILRINPDGSIPNDNPFFVTNHGIFKSIYAYGLRNPFTFSFSADHKLFANDVGESEYEEINNILPGKNYGWPAVSGFIKSSGAVEPANYVDPVHVYTHDFGCAITGSSFYNPKTSLFPSEFEAKYFFGDYCNNTVKIFDPKTLSVTTFIESNTPTTFIRVNDSGELYIASFAGSDKGSIWKISFTNNGQPKIVLQPEQKTTAANESVKFIVDVIGQQPLEYQWKKNGVFLENENGPALELDSVQLEDDSSSFSCVISNVNGSIESDAVTLHVTNRARPTVDIDMSLNDSLYAAGDTLIIKGSAFDEVQGPLSKSSFLWKIEFCHDHHTHPILSTQGVDSISFVIPRVGETSSNVWYRIHLDVVNNMGLSQTASSEIFPLKSVFTVTTSDDEIFSYPILLDGAPYMTPFSISAVAGMTRNLTVPDEVVINGHMFTRKSGNDMSVTFNVPRNDTTFLFTGNFSQLFLGHGAGLSGKYYNKYKNYEGPPDFTRIDSQLDFSWGYQPPLGNFNSDNFSVMWQGYIHMPADENYTLYTASDDGLRLVIDDIVLIDRLNDDAESDSVKKWFTAGMHPIQIYYYDASGEAAVKILWSSKSFSKRVIPKEVLYDDHYAPQVSFIQAQDSVKTGEQIEFIATANDFNGQSIDEKNFSWSLMFLSGSDSAVLATFTGSKIFTYTLSDSLLFNSDNYLALNVSVQGDEGFRARQSHKISIYGNSSTMDAYPNPIDQYLTLELAHRTEGTEILFYNAVGTLVLKKNLAKVTNRIQSLNISNLPPGLYIVKVLSGNSSLIKKFFKN